MFPELINYNSVIPLISLAAHATLALICSAILLFYRNYPPLRFLIIFYFCLTLSLLGWVITCLQRSEASIVWGYRIGMASLALEPACWIWLISSLLSEKMGKLVWGVTGISVLLFALALLGRGPYFIDRPLEIDPTNVIFLRPQSIILRPLITSFGFFTFIFYIIKIRTIIRLKNSEYSFLIYVLLGTLLWFMGGIIEVLRVYGEPLIFGKYKIWHLSSLGISLLLFFALVAHFRSVEQSSNEELAKLNRVKSKILDHLSHELKTPTAIIHGALSHLKTNLLSRNSSSEEKMIFEEIDKQLNHLSKIQAKAEKIIK